MDINTSEITDLVKQDFSIDHAEAPMNEDELLKVLTEEVTLMMETRMDFLLSLMYRLDIDENKIQRALAFTNIEEPNVALARLILNRQKQRIWSKKTYRTEKIEGWDDF